VDEDILNRATFKVGDDGTLNLGGLVVQFGDQNEDGTIRAITLIDVIVFATEGDAADLDLWAHELFHVRQYRDWGS
jgi:hypothetical protein